MSLGTEHSPPSAAEGISLQIHDALPPGVAALLPRIPRAELAASDVWLNLVARHYDRARGLWITAQSAGEMVGFLPAIRRRHRGVDRLESSLDGVVCGPQILPDLPPRMREAVFLALVHALGKCVGGRCMLAAYSCPVDAAAPYLQTRPGKGWDTVQTCSALVPCNGGIEAAEQQLASIRRRERDRSLRRGCTIQEERDPDQLALWYPQYRKRADRFAQEPVPLAFMQDLMHEAPESVVFGTVRREGELLGGHFGFISGGRLISWQGGVQDTRESGVFPVVLLYWLDIVAACSRGLDAVDFGGSAGRSGLWDFKRRFGAVPEMRRQFQRRSRLGHLLLRTARGYRSFVGPKS